MTGSMKDNLVRLADIGLYIINLNNIAIWSGKLNTVNAFGPIVTFSGGQYFIFWMQRNLG